MVFKALNSLTPEYLSDLLIRNCESQLQLLQNTSKDLLLSKKKQTMVENDFYIEL